MVDSASRSKRRASHLERVQSNHSHSRSPKRQKIDLSSLASAAKRNWYDPFVSILTPAKKAPQEAALKPVTIEQLPPPRLRPWAPSAPPPAVQPRINSTFSGSRQPMINKQNTFPATPQAQTAAKPNTYQRGQTLSAAQALALVGRRQQTPQTQTQTQPRLLTPIELDGDDKDEGHRRGGGGQAQSTSAANAHPSSSARKVNGRRPSAGSQSSAKYSKKRPIGKSAHHHKLAQRDMDDIDGLAQASSSATSPTTAPPAPAPLASSPQPPPSPEPDIRSKSELQTIVAQLGVVFKASDAISHGPNEKLDKAHVNPVKTKYNVDQALRNANVALSVPAAPRTPKLDEILAKFSIAASRLDGPAIRRRKFPPRLNRDEQDIVDQAMSNRTFHSELIGAEVSHRDLSRMRPGTWLNDEVITFFSVLINDRAKPVREGLKLDKRLEDLKLLNVWCFNHAWYGKLCNSGHAGVQRWTKKTPDVFKLDALIAPINLGNSHWVCAAINFKRKRIEYYDSLGGINLKVFVMLRTYLEKEDEKMRKKDPARSKLDLDEWEDFQDDDVPQQQNGCDCGIFTCQFMESLSRDCGGFDFAQENMPYLRNKMILEIAERKLIVEPWEK